MYRRSKPTTLASAVPWRGGTSRRVLDKLVGLKRAAPAEGRPWIDLDDRTRSSVDRVFHVLSVLRGCVDPSERDAVVLLALWYADACDDVYGKSRRSHWSRIVLDA